MCSLGEGVAEEAADGGHEVVVELLAGGVAAVLRFGEVGGEVAEEVVIEHLGDMHKQVGVDGTPIKYIIYVRTLAVQSVGKPFDVMVPWLRVEYLFYSLTDMHILLTSGEFFYCIKAFYSFAPKT